MMSDDDMTEEDVSLWEVLLVALVIWWDSGWWTRSAKIGCQCQN